MNDQLENNNKTETATFGTGCFWCTEAIFQNVEGIIMATSASFSCINVFNDSLFNSFETSVISNMPI